MISQGMFVSNFFVPIDLFDLVVSQVDVCNVPHSGEGEAGQNGQRVVLQRYLDQIAKIL